MHCGIFKLSHAKFRDLGFTCEYLKIVYSNFLKASSEALDSNAYRHSKSLIIDALIWLRKLCYSPE